MFVSVGESLENYEIVEYKGVVLGLANSAEGVTYRQTAIKNLVENAKKVGANAVINLRFEIYPINSGIHEATVYADAVILKNKNSGVILGAEEKPRISLDAYTPKQVTKTLLGEISVIGDYKFVICPKCGTKYKVETDEVGKVHIIGLNDVDDNEPGLQVVCLRCGTKFTVPEN